MKMKTSFLAASILAASSLSHAGLAPIGDTQLGDVTGQSGVSIEPTIRAEIGSIVYTDEGSIGINNIVFGGANKQTYFGTDFGEGSHSGNFLDNALVKIDVLDDGDVSINGGPAASSGNVVDFALSTGAIELISSDTLQSSTLISSINVTGLFTGFSAIIDADTLHTSILVDVAVDDIDIDISSLGIKVENAFITDSTFFEALDGRARGNVGNVPVEDLTARFIVDLYADDDGLHVELDQAEFDMGIGAIYIADASIGSFRMNNVNLNGLSVVISGHP